MASLIQHASGLYLAQFYDRSKRPQRKRLSLKTRNRRTAERLLAKLEAEYLMGEFDPWASPKLEEHEERGVPSSILGAVETYLADRAHLRPQTLRTYQEVMGAFAAWVGADSPVARLEPRHVLNWLDSTSAGPVTRKKYLSHLGYLFRYLVKEGAMEADLSKAVKLPKLPEQAPKAMTPEMVRTFVEKARSWPSYDYGWLGDLVEANVEMGLRRAELVALRPEHVDLERGILRVVNGEGFTTKSGKERAIPLSASTRRVLKRRLDGSPNYVFETPSRPLTCGWLTNAFYKVRKGTDLPEWVNVHSTRHTALTRLAEAGVPIEAIRQYAGHSSITVTERYTRMRVDTVADLVRRAFS